MPTHGFASPLSDLAATLEPGAFAELEVDGAVTTCNAMVPPADIAPGGTELGNILQFTDEALWDPVAREVYIMGTRRPYRRVDQQFVKYSEATNSWVVLERPPFNPGFHGYDHGAIDPDRRAYYRARTGNADRVWSMNITTGVWRELPRVPLSRIEQTIAMDYFPEIDGLVYFNAFYDAEYAVYTVDDDRWQRTSIIASPFGSLATFSEYDQARGVMLFGGGFHYTDDTTPDPTPGIDESRRVYMLDRDGIVTRLADAPTGLGQGNSGPVQTIDPNSGNLVVFPGIDNGHAPGTPCRDPLPIYDYDLDADAWRQTGTQQLFSSWCDMDTAAVPLYEYGVIFIVSVRSDTDCRVLLYRHSPGAGPGLDAGVGDGGARDGGARDGGARDGGARDGGARDGGARDGGARDATSTVSPPQSGCQCGLASSTQDSRAPWLLALFAGIALLRSRRPRGIGPGPSFHKEESNCHE